MARVKVLCWAWGGLCVALAGCGAGTPQGAGVGGTGATGGGVTATSGGQGFGLGGNAGVPDPAAQLGLTPCRDLSAHASSVAAASGSPYGLMVNALGASVLAVDEHRILRTFSGQFGPITAGVLGADGSWGATIGEDRALRLWHAADGREFAHLDFDARPTLLALSPGASPAMLAVVDDAAGLRLIDARDAHVKWSKTLERGLPSSLLFTPDGQALLLTTSGGVLRFSLSDGAQLSEFSLQGASLAATSGDGALLAVATTFGGSIALLNLKDGSAVRSINPRATASALALTRDARQLLVGTSSGVQVYDTGSSALLRTLDPGNQVSDVAVLADGDSVLVAAHETNLYHLSDGSRVDSFGQTGFVWGGSFAADGRLEFPGAQGPTQVWDANQGLRLSLVERSTESGNQGAVLFSPSGLLLVNFERTATFWDAAASRVVRSFEYDATDGRPGFNLMAFSKDGATLIGEGSPPTAGQIRFWDATNGKLLRTLPGHGEALRVLTLSPTGDLLASSGPERANADGTPVLDNNTIKLWDLTHDTSLIGTLQGHTGVITSIAFSPDGNRLLSSDQHGLVRLWSVPDGAIIRDLATDWTNLPKLVRTFGSSAAFSPDGELVASAGVDWSISRSPGAIELWSALDGAFRGRLLSLNEANLGSIQWSPDGKLLAAGTGSGMRIWCLDELPEKPPPPETPLH